VRTVHGVRKVAKWNTPFYGSESGERVAERGDWGSWEGGHEAGPSLRRWILSAHTFENGSPLLWR